MSFLPPNYERPKQVGRFIKLEKGTTSLRILSEPTFGYKYWNTQGEVVHLKEMPKELPNDIAEDMGGRKRIVYFWHMLVWSYESNSIKEFTLDKATVQDQIIELHKDSEWGDPRGYDIKIKREGDGIETTYSVIPSPNKKDITQEMKDAIGEYEYNPEKLFQTVTAVDYPSDDVNPEDVPF